MQHGMFVKFCNQPQRIIKLTNHNTTTMSYATPLATALSESSSFATLMVMSVLSHHNSSAFTGSVDDESRKLDNDLYRATTVLAVAFAITSSLPPSSLDVSQDFVECSTSRGCRSVVSIQGASEYNVPVIKDTCDDASVDTTDCESVSDEDSCHSSAGLSECPSISDEEEEEVDDEELDQLANMLSVVESNAVTTSWTSRTRLSRKSKPRTLLQQFQETYVSPMKTNDSLCSIPEYAGMPAMTPCDSLLSMSSAMSFSTRNSSTNLMSAPPKRMNMSPQRNAEWAIIE